MYFASMIVLESGEVLAYPGVDSHDHILQKSNKSKKEEFCKIEINPIENKPFSEWKIKRVFDTIPELLSEKGLFPEWFGPLHRIMVYSVLDNLLKDEAKGFIIDRELSKETIFRRNGLLHRQNGPALIVNYSCGSIWEQYYLNGKRHRIVGPASIFYNENRKIIGEDYYIDGKLHRTNGPATWTRCSESEFYEILPKWEVYES